MKSEKPPNPDEIELYPDAMERTERAIKAAFQQQSKPNRPIKGRHRSVKPRSVVKKR